MRIQCPSSRFFVAPDGREYMWKHGLARHSQVCHFTLGPDKTAHLNPMLTPDICGQLIETRTEQTAAEARLHPTTQQLTIGVGPTLLPFLDVVVLLFLVCEEERHVKNTFTAAADFITDVAWFTI